MAEKTNIVRNFIVLEGLDGSGTTTQMSLLADRLKDHGIPCMTTCEPSNHPIGIFIRKVLKREEKINPRTLAYLFAADRNEHLYAEQNGIIATIDSGSIVISDRYLFSSLAYQSEECGFDFVYMLNSVFPLPEHLFFLDVSPASCQNRLESRSQPELYDDIKRQHKVMEWYRRAFECFESSGMNIRHIDGEQQQDEIAKKIWSELQPLPINRV